jgi:NAD(P)-dependent dehydrogenase (short-subunit alcohol dehydrogenase family)
MTPSIVTLDPASLEGAAGKTVIVTGGAGGIGAATAALYNRHGANVVVTDLSIFQDAARKNIAEMAQPSRATFIPADILNWEEMKALFRQAKDKFGGIDIVVANAAIMESNPVLDMTDTDEDGEPKEPREAFKVIDVNLKGTLNSRLALPLLLG